MRRFAFSFSLDIRQRFLSGKSDLALLVDFDYLNDYLIAHVANILYLFNTSVFQLGNVYHSFFSRSELNERAETGDPNYLSFINRTDFGNESDSFYHFNAISGLLFVAAADKYIAILVDIYLYLVIGAELLYNLSAGADNLAYLVNGNLILIILGAHRFTVGRDAGMALSITSSRI